VVQPTSYPSDRPTYDMGSAPLKNVTVTAAVPQYVPLSPGQKSDAPLSKMY